MSHENDLFQRDFCLLRTFILQCFHLRFAWYFVLLWIFCIVYVFTRRRLFVSAIDFFATGLLNNFWLCMRVTPFANHCFMANCSLVPSSFIIVCCNVRSEVRRRIFCTTPWLWSQTPHVPHKTPLQFCSSKYNEYDTNIA